MENTGYVMPAHIIAGAGIVINEKDEVLMVKNHNAGWVFPGGQAEVGENVIHAVKREVMEETGVDIDVEEAMKLIQAPAIIELYKAYSEYAGRPIYMEYITKQSFELK